MNGPGDIVIRPLRDEFIEDVVRIHRAGLGYTVNSALGKDHLAFLYQTMSRDPKCYVGVALIDNQPVGVVSGAVDLGTLKCRLSFWTLPGLTEDYKETFEDVARSICVFDTTNDTAAGCSRVWLARDSAQESRSLEYGLEGKKSIINFLQKDGYNVEQL